MSRLHNKMHKCLASFDNVATASGDEVSILKGGVHISCWLSLSEGAGHADRARLTVLRAKPWTITTIIESKSP